LHFNKPPRFPNTKKVPGAGALLALLIADFVPLVLPTLRSFDRLF